MSQNGAIGVDLWQTNGPAHDLNGTYGDLLYVATAVDLIRQHAANDTTPLYLNLALQVERVIVCHFKSCFRLIMILKKRPRNILTAILAFIQRAQPSMR